MIARGPDSWAGWTGGASGHTEAEWRWPWAGLGPFSLAVLGLMASAVTV